MKYFVFLHIQMIEWLEKRWAQWKQPLLLLSFILHSHYGIDTFHSKNWLKSILLEFVKFKKKQYPFDSQTVEQFGKDIMSFWESCIGCAPELSHFALHLYSICVNATSVEWLGFFSHKKKKSIEGNYILNFIYLYIFIYRIKKS